MELVILGSSASIPTRERNLPAIALIYHTEIILFDCGEDVQRRFVDAQIKFNKPLKILISHFHGDHINGLPGLLFRFGLNDRTAPIAIFGPRNLFLFLYIYRKIVGLKPMYPLHVFEIDHDNHILIEYDGLDSENPKQIRDLKDNIIFENKRYQLKYEKVNHSILSFAYAFIEKPLYGKFNPQKAEELGIPHSRIRKKLQKGIPVEINGRIIDPLKEGVVGPSRPGKKITYSGDTTPCENLISLGKDSDLLIHEATYLSELAEIAIEKQHSTAVNAANDAKEANAKQLLLTHFSSRYEEEATKLLEEAKLIFPNVILAKDLMRISLK